MNAQSSPGLEIWQDLPGSLPLDILLKTEAARKEPSQDRPLFAVVHLKTATDSRLVHLTGVPCWSLLSQKSGPWAVNLRQAPPGAQGLGWAGPRPSYPQLLLGQVTAVIDATVHGHKALEGRPVPDIGVVEAGVEHDDGEGQDVAGVCGLGQRVRVLALVSLPSSALTPLRDQGSAISQPQRSTLSSWLGIRGRPHFPLLSGLPASKTLQLSRSKPLCAFPPLHLCSGWPPCQAHPPLPFSTHSNPPSLSAPASALLPAEPSQPRCPLCSLPPRISENTYCWHHCSGLSHVLLGNLAGIVGLLESEQLTVP